MAETNKEIITAETTECPYCGSDEVEGGFIEVDGDHARQKMSCSRCLSMWNSVFVHVGYEAIDK